MKRIGILAYGSLIDNPGHEIAPLIEEKIPVITPFPVEYARISASRGNSPTVVPYETGAPVKGFILVLREGVPLNEARDLLWRREVRKEGTGKKYIEKTSPNSVVVRESPHFPEFLNVLYTDFHNSGKIQPDPKVLAKAAINSVHIAAKGKDGIQYLINNISSGVKTPLTDQYTAQILIQTDSKSLEQALVKSRAAQ